MRARGRGKRIGGSSATHNTAWQAINYVADNLAIKRRQAGPGETGERVPKKPTTDTDMATKAGRATSEERGRRRRG